MTNFSNAATAGQSVEAGREYLAKARLLIDQGQPAMAARMIFKAFKSDDLDRAEIHEVRLHLDEYHKKKLQESLQLASLLAECTIAEA